MDLTFNGNTSYGSWAVSFSVEKLSARGAEEKRVLIISHLFSINRIRIYWSDLAKTVQIPDFSKDTAGHPGV
jgi:hypothetical protein